MAILGDIRKRTTVLILIIGLALFAFVISGVLSSDGFAGGQKVGTSIAEVNGDDISIDAFQRKVERLSNQYGGRLPVSQVRKQVYDQEIRNVVLGQQIEELGLDVQGDQIMDFISQQYAQFPDFQDEDGVFNPEIFRSRVAEWREDDPGRYQLWLEDEKSIIQSAEQQMYMNLVKAGVGATLKEGEFDYKLQSDKIDIEYVRVPYTSIADSTLQVSKSEIAAYVKDHAEDYKQEVARDIRFVFFEEKPSADDESTIKNAIVALIKSNGTPGDTIGFQNTTNIDEFLTSYSDTKFDTIYKPKGQLPSTAADSIINLEIGGIYGPYKDGETFKVSRLMNKKLGGNVKASHILFAYEGAERADAEITRTKEEAQAEAQKILAEAKAPNADFAELAKEHSDGPSGPRGGDLGFFQEGRMAAEFNDFCFSNDVGAIGLVETDFGFHIIKIDDKEDLYQVAHLTRALEPSEETTDKLYTDATSFEMAVMDADEEAFYNIAQENSYVVRPVKEIKELDESLPGIGEQRSIVQWTFKEDTKVGDIKRFDVGNDYAIVQVTKKYEEGLKDTESASISVLPKIRKDLKAEQIIAANSGKSFDDFAKDNNTAKSSASGVSAKSPTISGAGREPLVVGTAFGLKEGETSSLVKGESGVFMVRVKKRNDAIKLPNHATFTQTLTSTNANKVNTAVYNALKEGAEIEDKRADFY